MPSQKNPEGETSYTQMEPTGTLEVRAKEFISSKNPLQHGSNCSIAIVSPDDLHVIWDRVEPYLEAVIERSQGEAVLEDYYEHISTGDMQLWVAIEAPEILACMVTQIAPYPSKRVLRIISLGGMQMDSWIEFLPDVEHWAMGMGCSSLELWGRKGWLKILKDWECSYHVLTKDLKGRMH